MALLAALAGTTVLLSAGFPAGSPDRLPVLLTAVGLAVQEVARQQKKLFITHSTGTSDFTGKFC